MAPSHGPQKQSQQDARDSQAQAHLHGSQGDPQAGRCGPATVPTEPRGHGAPVLRAFLAGRRRRVRGSERQASARKRRDISTTGRLSPQHEGARAGGLKSLFLTQSCLCRQRRPLLDKEPFVALSFSECEFSPCHIRATAFSSRLSHPPNRRHFLFLPKGSFRLWKGATWSTLAGGPQRLRLPRPRAQGGPRAGTAQHTERRTESPVLVPAEVPCCRKAQSSARGQPRPAGFPRPRSPTKKTALPWGWASGTLTLVLRLLSASRCPTPASVPRWEEPLPAAGPPEILVPPCHAN